MPVEEREKMTGMVQSVAYRNEAQATNSEHAFVPTP
jgi:hypothetical protein